MPAHHCLTFALGIAALLSGTLNTWADVRGRRRLVYLCKPAATALILALAVLRSWQHPSPGWWIVVGLALSLGGDVLLMLPGGYFVPGLASFLLAQGCYLVAFSLGAPGLGPVWALIPGLLLLLGVAGAILPRAGPLRWPVLCYALTITAMAWRATTQHVALGTASTLLGLVGAWLFCISDLALAWGRFVQRATWLTILCLGSYYLAQLLIALSI